MRNTWQLQDAKNKFSELVERALKNGAQIITRRGERVAVLIPYQEYTRITRPAGSLADFLLNSPLPESGLIITRDASLPRDLEFEP